MRYAFYPGCVARGACPELYTSTIEVCQILGIELDEVEVVLRRIQQFEPSGIGARDLRECLLLQLRQLPERTEWLSEAVRLVSDHLDIGEAATVVNFQEAEATFRVTPGTNPALHIDQLAHRIDVLCGTYRGSAEFHDCPSLKFEAPSWAAN